MGPSAFRIAGLGDRLARLGYAVVDHGDLRAPIPETQDPQNDRKKYILDIARVCEQVFDVALAACADGGFPLVLGGDHSLAAGSVAAAATWARNQRQQPLGLIWIDAHADMNTPATSPSGNVHGMPLACCIGLGPRELTQIGGPAPQIEPTSVALIGLRSVDDVERFNVRGAGVHPFTMRDIDERGLPAVIREAIEVVSAGTAGFHLSFDMDAVDPREAPGVGTPVSGGITYREAHLLMELVCDSGRMTSLEMVEVNPVLDEANRTALLAVELATSALGKRIL